MFSFQGFFKAKNSQNSISRTVLESLESQLSKTSRNLALSRVSAEIFNYSKKLNVTKTFPNRSVPSYTLELKVQVLSQRDSSAMSK